MIWAWEYFMYVLGEPTKNKHKVILTDMSDHRINQLRHYSRVKNSLWVIGKTSLTKREYKKITRGKIHFDRSQAAYWSDPSMQMLVDRRIKFSDYHDSVYSSEKLVKITEANYYEDMNLVDKYFIDTIEYDRLLDNKNLEADDKEALLDKLSEMSKKVRSELHFLEDARRENLEIREKMAKQADMLTPVIEEEKRQALKARVQNLLKGPR